MMRAWLDLDDTEARSWDDWNAAIDADPENRVNPPPEIALEPTAEDSTSAE